MRFLQEAMSRYTLGLAACAAVVACASENITGSQSRFEPPPISIQPSVFTVTVGGSRKLLAALPAGSGGRDSEVAWRSASDSIASITAAGLVQGLKVGRTRITATWRGRHGSALVTVVSAGLVNKRPLCAFDRVPDKAPSTPKGGTGPCR